MNTENDCRCDKRINQLEEALRNIANGDMRTSIDEQTTPAPTPWSVKSEAYWHNQYQLMREKYHKQMDENPEQAESINKLEEQLNVMRFLFNQAAKELESEQAAKRELEEHSTKQDFLIDELADSLRAMVAHCEGFISNLKEGR